MAGEAELHKYGGGCLYGLSDSGEKLYRRMQSLSGFDLKASGWIAAPEAIRGKGIARFCERCCDTVVTIHNSADSYDSVRGFRGLVLV